MGQEKRKFIKFILMKKKEEDKEEERKWRNKKKRKEKEKETNRNYISMTISNNSNKKRQLWSYIKRLSDVNNIYVNNRSSYLYYLCCSFLLAHSSCRRYSLQYNNSFVLNKSNKKQNIQLDNTFYQTPDKFVFICYNRSNKYKNNLHLNVQLSKVIDLTLSVFSQRTS